jgi:hypothetical protein
VGARKYERMTLIQLASDPELAAEWQQAQQREVNDAT